MTIPKVSITCDRFADKLSEYLEREADEATRAGIDAHALSCVDCGQLLADLRALRLGAANLPELVPSRDLWKGISERIETPVVELKNGAAVVQSQVNARRRTRLWTGLAAAALVGVTATVTYEVTKRSVGATSPVVVATTTPTPSTRTTPAPTTTPPAVEPSRDTSSKSRPTASAPTAALVSDRPSAQQTYDTEIARLRIVVERRRSQLDSTTIAVLEHNLKVIDDAIRQCKAALLKDPSSQFLMESLNDALDNKVQLLRTAATLPSKA
jgi:putative zinc finger protein